MKTREEIQKTAAEVNAYEPHERQYFQQLTRRKRGKPSYNGKPSPNAIAKAAARDFYHELMATPGMTSDAALRRTKEEGFGLDRMVIERACGFRHG